MKQQLISKTFQTFQTFKQLKQLFYYALLGLLPFLSFCQSPENHELLVGAERTGEYINDLKGKSIALVVNHTSLVHGKHLTDTLLSLGVEVKKIFAPEHGFRGKADAGEEISTSVDTKTGIPIVSLYGNKQKPASEDLKDIDLVIYDIQDVGVRFYTYISTLHYVMEACAENNVPLLVLDRPNPNGYYVDGPVREPEFTSFVGLDPIPVVYGLTPAEYALMLNGEHWVKDANTCKLRYILCEGYDHNTFYTLPVNPSPNLRSMTAIHLYPSICFFEGTAVSVGRGTDKPFMLVGYPDFMNGNVSFTPLSIGGAKDPPYLNITCKGFDLSGLNTGFFLENKRLMLHWLIEFYSSFPDKEKFFTSYFDKLAGTAELRKQITQGIPELEIRRSWEPELSAFKAIREKYLLYKDFE